MTETKKLMVWSDQYDEKWEEEYREEHPDATDEEVMDAWYIECETQLVAERMNLHIHLDNPILVIQTLGLWNGTSIRCSMTHRDAIGDLLERFFDGNSFYVEPDTGDLVGEAYHHDGTNYYRFREISADAANDDIDDLMYKIVNGQDYTDDLARLTKSLGGRIAKTYGWEVNASDE